MTAQEFGRWQAFWEIDRTGPDELLWLARVLQAAVATGPCKSKTGKGFSAVDFITPDPWELFSKALQEQQGQEHLQAQQADPQDGPTLDDIQAAARRAGMLDD